MTNITELNITNFVSTGLFTSIARYSFTLEIKWIDDDGLPRVHGPQSYVYPNDLTAMPLSVRRKFAMDMINATVRVAIGLDAWERYE